MKGVMVFDQSAVTTSEPVSPSPTGSPLSSRTSRYQRSVKARMPSWPIVSPATRAASVMPKWSKTWAPQARSSLSRFTGDSGSAATISFFTVEAARSKPRASATFARCRP